MANLCDMKIKMEIDEYFTKTRINICNCINCKFINIDNLQCSLKEISIDIKGKCYNWIKKEIPSKPTPPKSIILKEGF